MAAPMPPGLLSVALREVRWIWHDRVALFLVVGVPLIAFAVLSLTFSNAVVRDLHVDVVDRDVTETSLNFVQALNAAPGVAEDRTLCRSAAFKSLGRPYLRNRSRNASSASSWKVFIESRVSRSSACQVSASNSTSLRRASVGFWAMTNLRWNTRHAASFIA